MTTIDDFFLGIWDNTLYRKLILSIIVVIITFLLQAAIRNLLVKRLTRLTGETVQTYTLRKIIDYVILTIGVIVLFGLWVQRSADLTVAVGLMAAGLAFALQEVIGSAAGWLSTVFGRPFVLGDRIEVDGITGDIIDIGVLRTTLMETGNWLGGFESTGRIVTLSNALIFKEPVFNYSRDIRYIWDEVQIGIPYGQDWERAREIMLDIIRHHPLYIELIPMAKKENSAASRDYAIKMPPLEPQGFVKIGDSWIEVAVIYPVWYNLRRQFNSDISEAILRRLADENIPLAFPTMSVELTRPAAASDD